MFHDPNLAVDQRYVPHRDYAEDRQEAVAVDSTPVAAELEPFHCAAMAADPERVLDLNVAAVPEAAWSWQSQRRRLALELQRRREAEGQQQQQQHRYCTGRGVLAMVAVHRACVVMVWWSQCKFFFGALFDQHIVLLLISLSLSL